MIARTATENLRRVAARATPHQRLFARTLMQQLDLDVRYVTSFHLRFFKTAGIAEPEPGEEIDTVLYGLTTHTANALIGALRKEVSDE